MLSSGDSQFADVVALSSKHCPTEEDSSMPEVVDHPLLKALIAFKSILFLIAVCGQLAEDRTGFVDMYRQFMSQKDE